MWTANRTREGRTEECAADQGVVTLGGDPAAVYLGGERRWVSLYTPGGYQWRPKAGDKVLVVKAGDHRELPCLVGKRPDALSEEAELSPGSGRIHSGTGVVLLDEDGLTLMGDDVPDGAGGFETLDRAQALLARVLFRLTARRGQFPFLPEMGSRLYLLGRERPSAREALALQYVTEALAQEADLAVLGTELQEDGTGAAVLTANLEWRGTPLAVQVDMTL